MERMKEGAINYLPVVAGNETIAIISMTHINWGGSAGGTRQVTCGAFVYKLFLSARPISPTAMAIATAWGFVFAPSFSAHFPR